MVGGTIAAVFVRPAVHHGDTFKIAVGWGRRCLPLQGVGLPRVLGGFLAKENAENEIGEEDQLGQTQQHGTDGHEPVEGLEGLEELVQGGVEIAPWMATDAEDMHGVKGAIGQYESQREVELSKRFRHHAAEHLGEPELGRGEQAKQGGEEQHIVDVRNDEVGVVDLHIHRGDGHEDT